MATGIYGGETVFGGHGAGGHPTAVAVVSDILAIVPPNKLATAMPRRPPRDRPP